LCNFNGSTFSRIKYIAHIAVSVSRLKKGKTHQFLETPINYFEGMKNCRGTREVIEVTLQKYKIETQGRNTQFTASSSDHSKPNPMKAEAVRRARSLVQLKNSPETIRTALMSSVKLSVSEIEEIIKDAFSVYEDQQKQRNQRILIYSVAIMVFLILFFIVLSNCSGC
jgi:hypothetical protein